MIYIGTYDISIMLGCSVKDDAVKIELEKYTKMIRERGKSVGCLFHDEKELNYFKNIGINFLVYGVDSGILYNGFSRIKDWRKK